MSSILNIANLDLTLENTSILRDISLEINEGETTAVIGPNGSGKSSLAYTIMGLKNYTPDRGEIFFKGEEISG